MRPVVARCKARTSVAGCAFHTQLCCRGRDCGVGRIAAAVVDDGVAVGAVDAAPIALRRTSLPTKVALVGTVVPLITCDSGVLLDAALPDLPL